jgi:predicted enzyme related to lactoylglutathione lyase
MESITGIGNSKSFKTMTTQAKNPFTWVEIYVDDMDRAQSFYETVLQIKMLPMQMPGEFGDLEMMSFPWAEDGPNISGALCKTSDMKPGTGGTLVYFTCDDCAIETARVEAAGGQVLQEKYQVGEHGFVSIASDTEGNTIGFHSSK